jgi:aminopeptidase Y
MVGFGRLPAAGGLLLLSSLPGSLQLQVPLQLDQQPLGASAPAASPLPLISTEALQESISVDNLLSRAEELYLIAKLSEKEYNHPTRVIGSKGRLWMLALNLMYGLALTIHLPRLGHHGTLSYINSTLAKLGDYYTVSGQSFPAVTGNVFESRLVLGDEVPESAAPMSLTPPTKNKQPVHGDLVLVGNEGCSASDFPKTVAGNIAFIRRGVCSFGTKSELAGKAGAVAAVVYNNEKDSIHATLGTPSPHHIATFGLSGEDATRFIEKLKSGEKVGSIAYIDAEVNTIVTENIVAQTKGGDQDNCVVLGGHSDGVAEGPGINDDGSGTLTLLEVATQLTKFSVNNCVRFAWWSAEEEGLLGSDYYASHLSAAENIKIRLFMDYDMLASPNYVNQVYNSTNDGNPVGSEELRDLYINWYSSNGLNYTLAPFDGRSDYVGFLRAGIPAGGFSTGADGTKTSREQEMFGGKAGYWHDPCYHQICDDVSNLHLDAWEANAKVSKHKTPSFPMLKSEANICKAGCPLCGNICRVL